jgi:hypothetical protein
MDVIQSYTDKSQGPGPTKNLVYLAKPVYGGWVTFTAHLSQKFGYPIHKVTKRSEKTTRPFGYGRDYQNLSLGDVLLLPNLMIVAVDKHYWTLLQFFPKDTEIVIHDPTECKTSKDGNPLVQETDRGSHLLQNFKVVTIRDTVQQYLKDEHGVSSVFKKHPFYDYELSKGPGWSFSHVSIARIDFDKNTDILLRANALLKDKASSKDSKDKAIYLFGAENRIYVHHKLKPLHIEDYWKGKFPKEMEPSLDHKSILKDADYMIDMSTIKGDGGGTQYTFLEAIHNDCVLVLNNEWIKKGDLFVSGLNCIGVSNETELAEFLASASLSQDKWSQILSRSKDILLDHTSVVW